MPADFADVRPSPCGGRSRCQEKPAYGTEMILRRASAPKPKSKYLLRGGWNGQPAAQWHSRSDWSGPTSQSCWAPPRGGLLDVNDSGADQTMMRVLTVAAQHDEFNRQNSV